MEGERPGNNGGSEGLMKGARDRWREDGGLEGVRNEWTKNKWIRNKQKRDG